MSESLLPGSFRDLEPYLDWSLSTERERIAKRVATPMDEIIKFHGAMLARIEEIITYLNQYPYAEMPADGQRLCDLALSLVEVCNLVEMYKDPSLLNMVDEKRFISYE